MITLSLLLSLSTSFADSRIVAPGRLAQVPQLSAAATSATSVRLQFSDADASIIGYYLYAVPKTGALTTLAWLPKTATSYDVSNLTPSSSTCYDIRAYSGNGSAKLYSPTVQTCATTPSPAAAVPSFRPTVWVDASGHVASAAHLTWFPTINAALASATVGQTIGVLPGTYNESVTISKSVQLVAMASLTDVVNPSSDPENTSWPVVINPPAGHLNGIKLTGGTSNVTVHGFFVESAGFNGIQMYGAGSAPLFTKLCSGNVIEGNRIDNVMEDGIKASQCTNLKITGNVVNNFSLINGVTGTAELEQGIDFVAVANSVIENNKIMAGGTGMTVKGGSISVTVQKNHFVGPFKWIELSTGEPTLNQYAFASATSGPTNYVVKNLLVTNNTFDHGANSNFMVLWACHNCSVTQNTVSNKKIEIIQDTDGTSENLCFDADFAIENHAVPLNQITRTSCQTKWPNALLQTTASGSLDMH